MIRFIVETSPIPWLIYGYQKLMAVKDSLFSADSTNVNAIEAEARESRSAVPA